MGSFWWAGCRLAVAGMAACCAVAGAQNLVQFSGLDSGSGARPNSDAAAAAFDAAAVLLGDQTLHVLDFEGVPLGLFLSLPPAQTGFPELSILPAAASSGADTSISDEIFAAEGFNTTPGGTRFLKIEEFQPGEPAVGVTFEFSNPIVAFGAYVTGTDPNVAGAVTATFDNGTVQIIPLDGLAGGGAQFWGFTDSATSGISSVTFIVSPEGGVNTDAFGLDDVRWVYIPEPDSALLLLVAGVLFARRRREGGPPTRQGGAGIG